MAGTPHLPDWRDGLAYARLAETDRAGVMWEWLRRDAGYVAWQARASRVTGGDRATRDLDEVDACLDLAPRDWGLHFR